MNNRLVHVVQVYRATWRHTDVAAKEYLAIPPPTDSEAAATGEPGSPTSEAAKAHAQVGWVTTHV